MARVYADVHVPEPVVNCLRGFGADVLRVVDDGHREESDERLLARAAAVDRVMLTCDRDFIAIGRRWQREGRQYPGIAWIKSDEFPPLVVAESVMILLEASHRGEIENQVHFVPF